MSENKVQLDNRARAKTLFQFLKEYSLLRHKMAKNTQRYEYVSDFPLPIASENPWVTYSFRGSASDESPILRVEKPRYSACPRPAASFRPWLQDGWNDYKRDVVLDFPNERTSDLYSSVEEAFGRNAARVRDYEEWIKRRDDWVKTQQAAQNASNLFERFFEIHTDLGRNSETIELVAASMRLKCLDDKEIDHPLLTKRLKTVFDRENNVISLVDADDSPRLYTELLSSISGLNYSSIRDAEKELEESECHPFDLETATPIFKKLINSLTSRGQFLEHSDEPIAPGTRLVVARECSLILRQKPSGAAQAIGRVLDALNDEEAEIPRYLVELIGGEVEEVPEPDESERSIEERLAEINGEASDILLAKPANREQLEIARRIERTSAVLVQGPPGTGKTHTIANLMGHFLAQGKSVLVSSYTTKALSVLKDKLPSEMQGLCVSAIDGATADMERSVDAIVERQSEVTAYGLNREIAELGIRRESVIKDLAETRRSLFDDLDCEYEPIEYQGEKISPVEAARYVGENAEELADVIPGGIQLGADFPLSDEELADLYRGGAHLTKEAELALESLEGVDGLACLMEPDEFADLAQRYHEASSGIDSICLERGWSYIEKNGGVEVQTDFGAVAMPGSASPDVLRAVRELATRYGTVEPWMLAAASDGLRGDEFAGLWRGLCDCILETDRLSTECRIKTFGHVVEIVEDAGCREVKRALLARKHKLGRGRLASLFGDLFDSGQDGAANAVLLDGHGVQTADDCDLALCFLEATEERRRCARCWDQLVTAHGGPAFGQLDPLQPEHAAANYIPLIKESLSWYEDASKELAGGFAAVGIDPEPVLRTDSLLTEEGRVAELASRLQGPVTDLLDLLYCWTEKASCTERSSRLGKVLETCSSEGNALVAAALYAVEGMDAGAYKEAYDKVAAALAFRDEWARRHELLQRVEAVAPCWAQAVRLRSSGQEGPDVPTRIRDAWRYKQYAAALAQLHNPMVGQLQERAVELSREYRRLTTQLASAQAWLHLLEKTQSDRSLNQALNGWKQTMKRVGKGTGKRAPELRAQARRLMAQCQEAVPGWIMPMDVALATFEPRRTHFDVLIVDEASQADITSLALTYLADRLIVVGDDKQVSPMAVGVDVQTAQGGIESHIGGVIPNAHLYGPKTSLYDLAATTFQPLMLREHFRCMPDIIGYCNMTSYDGKIKPLRDRGSSNLIPSVVERHVEGGMRSANGKTNEREAEETACIIRSCLAQPEYRDKTFGVISLLGPDQAMLVQKELFRTLGPAVIEEHKILCGDAANFQGDERDVIILNLVDSNEGPGPLHMRSEGPDDAIKKRYNVAVSRAKDQLWVVHSLDVANDLKAGDLRRGLIDYARNPQGLANLMRVAEAKADSPFESEVAKALIARGYAIEQQFPVGSYRIDIAIVEGRRRIAIECDGERWHSGERKVLEDLERQTVLERLGWQFVRIRGSRYYADKKAAMEEVFVRLGEMGIEPGVNGPCQHVSSDLLDRVIAGIKDWTVKDGASLAKSDLKGTRLREEVIADALDERSFKQAPVAASTVTVQKEPDARNESIANGVPKVDGPAAAKLGVTAAERLKATGTGAKEQPVAKAQSMRSQEAPVSKPLQGHPRFSRSRPFKKGYEVAELPHHALDSSLSYGVGQGRSFAISNMERTIEIEGPVEINVLIARVRASFGFKRAGIDIANKSLELLKLIPHETTHFNGRNFVWPLRAAQSEVCYFRVNGGEYDRQIEEIAPEELVAALRFALLPRGRHGLLEDDLLRDAARALGFKRTGGRIYATLRAALKLACDDDAIRCSFGNYYLPR